MIAFEAPHLRARHIIHIPGGSLVQRSDGRVLYGATKERVGFDRRLRAGAVQEMLNGALATLPALADCPLSAIWTGFRPEPEDGLPLIGRDPRSGLLPGHRPPHPRHHHELAHRPNHRPPPHRPRPRLPHPPLQPRPTHLSLTAATRHPGVRSRDPAAPTSLSPFVVSPAQSFPTVRAQRATPSTPQPLRSILFHTPSAPSPRAHRPPRHPQAHPPVRGEPVEGPVCRRACPEPAEACRRDRVEPHPPSTHPPGQSLIQSSQWRLNPPRDKSKQIPPAPTRNQSPGARLRPGRDTRRLFDETSMTFHSHRE